MRLIVTKMNLGLWAAAYIKEKINTAVPTAEKPFVLGLPTGGTVVDMYANLRMFHKQGTLSFKNVISFNMDEYVGLPKDHPQSYHSYMHQNLFGEVDELPQNIHILNGQAADLNQECADYEAAIEKAGGIDLFLGGVGRNGHIAFNEPGSSFSTRTRLVKLTPSTIEANSRFFLNDTQRVPHEALSVGIGTVLEAKEILFLASGDKKAEAVAHLFAPGTDANWPITALKTHAHATLLVDMEAAGRLPASAKASLDAQMQANPAAEHWVLEVPEK